MFYFFFYFFKKVDNHKNKIRSFMIAIIWLNALVWSLVPFFGWSSYGNICKN